MDLTACQEDISANTEPSEPQSQQTDVAMEEHYTYQEDFEILEHISKHDMYAQVMGSSLWQYMEKKTQVCPGRSAMSMKHRFHEIAKDENVLHRFELFLSQDQIDRLHKCQVWSKW